jgi:hypothetical protein
MVSFFPNNIKNNIMFTLQYQEPSPGSENVLVRETGCGANTKE